MVKITIFTNGEQFKNKYGLYTDKTRTLEVAKILENLAKELRSDVEKGIYTDNFIMTDELGNHIGSYAYVMNNK